jgi:hypothetical protein
VSGPTARRILILAVATLVALGAGGGVLAAERLGVSTSLVPFSATFTEDGPAFPCPFPTLCITINGTGHATQLGRTIETSSATINLLSLQTTGCSSENRTAVLTAANGDEIDVTFIGGVTCMTSPTSGASRYTYAITGGTGRFTGASGSGTAVAGFTLVTATSPASSFTTLNGLLSSPGSLR